MKNLKDYLNAMDFELLTEEVIEYKGMRYKIRHKYQSSGEDLIDILKKQLLKTLSAIRNSEDVRYNKDVNIFG